MTTTAPVVEMMDMLKVNLMMNTKDGNPLWTLIMLTVIETSIKYLGQLIDILKNALDAWIKQKFKSTVSKLPLNQSEQDYGILFARKYGSKAKHGDEVIRIDAVLAKGDRKSTHQETSLCKIGVYSQLYG